MHGNPEWLRLSLFPSFYNVVQEWVMHLFCAFQKLSRTVQEALSVCSPLCPSLSDYRASLVSLDPPGTRRQCQLQQPQDTSSLPVNPRKESEDSGQEFWTTSATNQGMTLIQSSPASLGHTHPIFEMWALA